MPNGPSTSVGALSLQHTLYVSLCVCALLSLVTSRHRSLRHILLLRHRPLHDRQSPSRQPQRPHGKRPEVPLFPLPLSLVILHSAPSYRPVSPALTSWYRGIVFKDVKHDLESLEGVSEIHDLHIWSLTIGKPALSVHVKSNEDPHV